MAIEVKIPQISEDVESAEVIEVLVSKGDRIEKEQSIIALETDKASVEVPSSHAGKVKEIRVKEGDEVKVGDVILTLEAEDEEQPEDDEKESHDQEEKRDKSAKKEANDEAEKQTEAGSKNQEDKPRREAKDDKEKKESASEEKDIEKKEEDEPDEEESSGNEKNEDTADIPASPAIRRLAREIGVKISELQGSGPGGRITREDVKAHSKKTASGKGLDTNALPDFSKWGAVEKEPLSNIRKTTAKNLTGSWQTIPHVTQFDAADIARVEDYMEGNSEKIQKSGGKLTITAILVKVLASAMQQFPKFNSSIDLEKEEIIIKKYFHIGIAVATEKGLLVPVIRDVNHKNISDLAIEITETAEKAKNGELTLEDMQGGNITLSNLGGIGGTQFSPIVYPPQVAILGVSRATIQPVFKDGQFEPRKILPLSLSYDHRLIDGAEGAEFLRWVCLALEDPFEALLS